ncbi:hypothetical protein [Acinetobacter higginsii]|uniref:hypothetical protein n=1 Tax=Acinetobacter higginsii TaxID=70347 RepID=UPI002675E377|nr:hypothetical protein [Acinetobacter higginsii]MDO3665039.1 hypothetical protein [Acinetobacter higginsii]
MKESVHVIEHTPINNWHEFQQRQKQIKSEKLLKNCIEGAAALCTVMFTCSLLFWGI